MVFIWRPPLTITNPSREFDSRPMHSMESQIMEWFSQNWVWVLFFAGMIAMHLFGHGGHGGHRGHRGQNDPKPPRNDGDQRPPEQGQGHQH